MKVSVILIAYHSDKWLPACVESLKKASKERVHLVLVDNSGNTLLPTLDYGSLDVEIIQTPNPMGFAEANNYGLTHARKLHELILFLNQDTICTDGCFDIASTCFEQHPDVGAMSPLIYNYDRTGWDKDFEAFVSQSGKEDDLSAFKDGEKTFVSLENVPAPALFVRKIVLKEFRSV